MDRAFLDFWRPGGGLVGPRLNLTIYISGTQNIDAYSFRGFYQLLTGQSLPEKNLGIFDDFIVTPRLNFLGTKVDPAKGGPSRPAVHN